MCVDFAASLSSLGHMPDVSSHHFRYGALKLVTSLAGESLISVLHQTGVEASVTRRQGLSSPGGVGRCLVQNVWCRYIPWSMMLSGAGQRGTGRHAAWQGSTGEGGGGLDGPMRLSWPLGVVCRMSVVSLLIALPRRGYSVLVPSLLLSFPSYSSRPSFWCIHPSTTHPSLTTGQG